MPVRAVDDKPSDTLVVVSGEGFWTGSSTLPHLHQLDRSTMKPGSDAGAAAFGWTDPSLRSGLHLVSDDVLTSVVSGPWWQT